MDDLLGDVLDVDAMLGEVGGESCDDAFLVSTGDADDGFDGWVHGCGGWGLDEIKIASWRGGGRGWGGLELRVGGRGWGLRRLQSRLRDRADRLKQRGGFHA